MPPDHQKYLEWNGERFRKWAAQIGTNTVSVVNNILASGRVEQQSYRSCMGLLKLAEKYSPAQLEKACQKALCYSGSPSYKSIKNLLVTMKEEPIIEVVPEKKNAYGITRGARYYAGKSQGGNHND